MASQQTWGFLAIDKPLGKTSRQAVDRVRRLLGEERIGHAGTLDPGATGVLLLAIGPATRLIHYAQATTKEYLATFRLGETSDSGDLETECRPVPAAPVPTRAALEQACRSFLGTIPQVPPLFSAVKVAGRRAYRLARAGRSVELPPRPVRIDSLEILDYHYPELRLGIRCGRGTYIRSLGRDLAAAVGTSCVMSALQRTAVGPARLENACPWAELSPDGWTKYRLPAERFLEGIPHYVCTEAERALLRGGGKLAVVPDTLGNTLLAFDSAQQLLALMTRKDSRSHWRPTVNFVPHWDRLTQPVPAGSPGVLTERLDPHVTD